MRIIQKLSLAFILTTGTIVAIGGAIRAPRELAVLEYDRVRDHRLMGRAVGSAIAAVWRSDGEAKALAVLERANGVDSRVRMRWVWLEGAKAETPAIDPSLVLSTPTGDSITRTVESDGTAANPYGMRYTYVPLPVDRSRRGALELAESLAGQQRFTHRVVTETFVTTLILVLASAALSTLLGVWLIGRPMRALADKARRVGQGDFAGPLVLPQRDELGELAREMNTMCEQLVSAHAQVAEETAQKQKAQEQLRHADRLSTVGKLAAGLAHELGTPLNVVSGRAQMILGGDTTETERADYARVIIDATDKMTRIIRQLLEFGRRKIPKKASCSLGALVDKTLEMLAPLASKRQVELVRDPASKGDIALDADASALEQVLMNLVVNAVQAMEKPGQVRVGLFEESATPPGVAFGAPVQCAVLSVADGGHGIPESDLAHVFEPFFTTKDVGEGTGLGLSVAYGIIQEHGGWIDVTSEVGKGSTFRVALPLV